MAALKALLEHGLSGAMIFDVNLTQAQPKIDKLQKGMFCESSSCFHLSFGFLLRQTSSRSRNDLHMITDDGTQNFQRAKSSRNESTSPMIWQLLKQLKKQQISWVGLIFEATLPASNVVGFFGIIRHVEGRNRLTKQGFPVGIRPLRHTDSD